MKKIEKIACPECGTRVVEASLTLECDYCLSKVSE